MFLIIAGCNRKPVFSAFKGKFPANENNKVITYYCTSCHTHNSFFPNEHVTDAKKIYTEKKYTETNECRGCHYLKTTFLGDIIEKTYLPAKK